MSLIMPSRSMNTNARSPIFGREGLMAEVTARGTVRIRGFSERRKKLEEARAASDHATLTARLEELTEEELELTLGG